MRELFLKIFGNKEAGEFTEISMFSWHHILYLVLIIGVIVALSIIFFKKSTSVIVEGDIVNIPKDEDDNIYLTTQLSYSVYRGAVKSINKKNSS